MVDKLEAGERWQHVKRGTSYEVLGLGELQMQSDLVDGSSLVIYRGDDGRLWAREEGEFLDGRFVKIATPTQDTRDRAKVLEEAAGIADGLAYIARENKQHPHPLPCDTNEAWRRVEDACWDIAESIRALGNKETDRHG